jgi:SAM-dependent methyltransferase
MSDLRFNRVAELYSRVRPTYPDAVYQRLREAVPVERFSTAVDIGCGAGQSLAGLAAIASHIIGIEPGDRLRDEARRAYPDAEIRDGTGESTGLPGASADLVTVATAFYWMDKSRVLAEVARVLRAPGVFATYKYGVPVCIGPAEDVMERHMTEHWAQHRSARLTEYDDTADLMRRSGSFASVTSSEVPYVLAYPSPGGYVEFLCSTSYVSAFLATLDDPDAYVASLAEETRAAHGDGELQVRFDILINIAVKRPA